MYNPYKSVHLHIRECMYMSRKTTPAPKPKAKPRAKPKAKAAEPKVATDQLGLVTPLDKNALQTVLNMIDNSDVKGADAQNILLLKQELIRAAGLKPQSPPQA